MKVIRLGRKLPWLTATFILCFAGTFIESTPEPKPGPRHVNPSLQAAIEEIQFFRDRWGFIVQANGDGGDTAQREGMFMLAMWVLHKEGLVKKSTFQSAKKRFRKNIELLEELPGTFVRHPDPRRWYSNSQNFSRDQSIPQVVALDIADRHDVLFDVFLKHLQRGFFYPNTKHNFRRDDHWKLPDFAGPTHLAVYIRSFHASSLYPVLWITDTIVLADVLYHCFVYARDKQKTSDDLNLMVMLTHAKYSMPTPMSWLARKIYASFRPVAGEYSTTDNGPQSALDWYFRPETGAPPMNAVWRPIVDRHFQPWDFVRTIREPLPIVQNQSENGNSKNLN